MFRWLRISGDESAYELVPSVPLTDFQAALRKIHAHDASFTEVTLKNQPLTTQELTDLCNALKNNNIVTSLDISGTPVDDANSQNLANLHLKTLIASNCHLNDKRVEILAKSKFITTLNIEANEFSENGVRALVANVILQSLLVGYNSLGRLTRQFASMPLHNLDMRANGMQDDDAMSFNNHPSLKKLGLSGNLIKDSSCQALALSTVLTEVDLRYNKVTREGLEAIKNNPMLMFHLEGNCINKKALETLKHPQPSQ